MRSSQTNRRRTPAKNSRRSREVVNLDFEKKEYVHIPKTVKYDLHKQMQSSDYNKSLCRKIKPEDFNRIFYNERTGLTSPLVFKCDPRRLGMKMVDASFDFEQVAQMVGRNRIIPVTSDTNKLGIWMTLDELAEYMKKPPHQRDEIYNSISLEFSNSGLADHVSAPALVRELDWGSHWPDAAKFRSVIFQDDGTHSIQNHYPRAEHFCLITSAGAFTNFHVDFHGSSVWYHVKKGKKVFWIVSPTENNLAAYERWERDPKETRFFGEVAEENTCQRVVLEAGTTLILPSGWIHAVSTPEDSLVFGGNFLHTRAATMQLRIKRQEDIIGIDKSARYQNEDEALLYYLHSLVKAVTGRQYIRPSSRADPPSIDDVDSSTILYCGQAFTQEGRHKSYIEANDYEDGGKALEPIAEDPVFVEYIKSGAEDERKPVKSNGATDQQLVEEHFWDDLTFFHPKSWGMDKKTIKGTNLAKAVSKAEPALEINQDALREKIHPNDVPQLRRLIQYLHDKKSIVLPRGLSRPHSLIACLEALLTKSEAMDGLDEEGEDTPSTSAPSTPQETDQMNGNTTQEDDSEPPTKVARMEREEEEEQEENEDDEDAIEEEEEDEVELDGEHYEVPAFEESDEHDEVDDTETDGDEEEQMDVDRVEEGDERKVKDNDVVDDMMGKTAGDEESRVDVNGVDEAPRWETAEKTPLEFERERMNAFVLWLRVHKNYLTSKWPDYDRRSGAGYTLDERCSQAVLIFKDLEQEERNWWIDLGKEDYSRDSRIAEVFTTRCDCWSPYCLLTLNQAEQ